VTLAHGLYGAAALLLVAGLGLRVAPTRLSGAAVAPLDLPAVAVPDSAVRRPPPMPRYAPIVTTNIFSQDRTAPPVRFSLPGRAVAPPKPRGPVLRLFGITVGPHGAVAIIDADPKIPGSDLYRVGDVVAGARLVAITDSTVTLVAPAGPLVLRLAPRRKP
jgi:hypothetical protein